MKLTVVFANTYRTYIGVVHENQFFPYEKRTVQIEFTEEQKELLKKRFVGSSGNEKMYEEIFEAWIEEERVGDNEG